MYNILLVDDEILISQGMNAMVKRLNHDEIGDVHFCYSAEEALEIFRNNQIDMILTDICMPEKNGLELISEIRETSNVPIGVISGHDDFAYVDKAYKLDIVGYMLKPIIFEELGDLINKMVGIINKRIDENNSKDKHNKVFTNTLIENKINRYLLLNQQDNFGMMSITREMENYFPYANYAVGLIRVNKSEHKIIHDLENNLTNDFYQGSRMNVYHMIDYKNDLVLVFNFVSEVTMADVMSHLETLRMMNDDSEHQIIYSISSIDKGFDHIYRLHNEAFIANNYSALFAYDGILEYSKYKEDKNHDKSALEKEISHMLRAVEVNDHVKMIEYVDDLFSTSKLKNYDYRIIEWAYKVICHELSVLNERNEVDVLTRDISDFVSLKEIRIYLKSWILKNNRENEKITYQSPVDIVIEFIKNNYAKDISLSYASNLVSLNYTYFSKTFKDHTGMNFHDYLTQYRMGKAKELLEGTNYNIKEIAKEVGYKNHRNFSNGFKKVYGRLPTEFRKMT